MCLAAALNKDVTAAEVDTAEMDAAEAEDFSTGLVVAGLAHLLSRS